MVGPVRPLHALSPARFDTPTVLVRLNAASRQLAEFKGVASSIPNQDILINSLGLQEAKDSSAIENIVTTHDELFQQATLSFADAATDAAKEVANYRQALRVGFEAVQASGLLTNNHILAVQAELEQNRAGFRSLPGTVLRADTGDVVYTPPDPIEIVALMTDLERFINDDGLFAADPLVKMALLHHQFESIHPFYDGNGRTGRILCVLYLVKQRLLDIPVLYLSRRILSTKPEYYRLLQTVRERDAWEDWVVYMLEAVEDTARQGIATVHAIKEALLQVKHRIRSTHRFYSQDLINNLFLHPYTKIDFVKDDLDVTRLTATRYLDALVADGILEKRKVGRTNYYINLPLYAILTGEGMTAHARP
ncbi:MAG: Fic family protein [Vicinamibacterales bacterium]